jgi:chorismate mutase
MGVRAIRGAITINEDKSDQIIESTRVLLEEILTRNSTLSTNDIASVIFTVTNDIKSEYPAKAAREMGWNKVPLLCAREIPVQGSIPLCIRVLLHWNTDLSQDEINHVYLRGAEVLRPDIG